MKSGDDKKVEMSSASMDQLLLYIEFPIDFKGQQLCKDYVRMFLIVSLCSVVLGFATPENCIVGCTFGATISNCFEASSCAS